LADDKRVRRFYHRDTKRGIPGSKILSSMSLLWTIGIVDGKCICCFTEVITEECPYCEEEILIPSRDYGIAEIKCPSCGKAVL